jgi:hypothetical protein
MAAITRVGQVGYDALRLTLISFSGGAQILSKAQIGGVGVLRTHQELFSRPLPQRGGFLSVRLRSRLEATGADSPMAPGATTMCRAGTLQSWLNSARGFGLNCFVTFAAEIDFLESSVWLIGIFALNRGL